MGAPLPARCHCGEPVLPHDWPPPMLLQVNPRNPEPRKVARAVDVLKRGGVIAYPTDTVYGLGCDITNKHAVERIYRMKRMTEAQLLSFVCPDLSDIARYGVVQDFAYR